jgi:hypothetical protein
MEGPLSDHSKWIGANVVCAARGWSTLHRYPVIQRHRSVLHHHIWTTHAYQGRPTLRQFATIATWIPTLTEPDWAGLAVKPRFKKLLELRSRLVQLGMSTASPRAAD